MFIWYFLQEWPPIERLPVHLPLQQAVNLRAGVPVQTSLDRASVTKLLAWFQLNREEAEMRQAHPDRITAAHCAHNLLYCEIPQFYTWHKKERQWMPRKRLPWPVGRMHACGSHDTERFCLRLLLLHVKGAQSYEQLRTVDGEVCETFKEAARCRMLLEDDNEYDLGLAELKTHAAPVTLRKHFAHLLLWAQLQTPKQLWEKYRDAMAEDFVHAQGCTQVSFLCLIV